MCTGYHSDRRSCDEGLCVGIYMILSLFNLCRRYHVFHVTHWPVRYGIIWRFSVKVLYHLTAKCNKFSTLRNYTSQNKRPSWKESNCVGVGTQTMTTYFKIHIILQRWEGEASTKVRLHVQCIFLAFLLLEGRTCFVRRHWEYSLINLRFIVLGFVSWFFRMSYASNRNDLFLWRGSFGCFI